MAFNRLVSAEKAQAQTQLIKVTGTANVATLAKVTMNGKTVTYTVQAAETTTTVATALQALLAAEQSGEFAEVDWTNPTDGYIQAQAKIAGKPFTISSVSGTGGLTLSITPLSTPTNDTFTTTSTGGSLSNGTYYYRVTAFNALGETQPSTETSLAISGGTSTQTVTVKWLQVSGAVGYKIYGRNTGAELFIASVTGEATLSYLDTGSITPAGGLPSANTTNISNLSPNDNNDALNWSAGVPAGAQDLVLDGTDESLWWGLDATASVGSTSINIASSFTGQIGLPERASTGLPNGANSTADSPSTYEEYRPQYWKIQPATWNIGDTLGGTGSGFIKIDQGSVQTALNVYSTANATDPDYSAVQFKGTHASNIANIDGGSVDIGYHANDTSTMATLKVGGSSTIVRCGSGVTLGTVTVNDGTVLLNSAIGTSLTVSGGNVTLAGTGAVAALTINGGTVVYSTSGTLSGTTVIGGNGVLDFSQDVRPKTIGGITLDGPNCKVLDPFKVTGGIAILYTSGAGPSQVDYGTSQFTLTRS